MAVLLTNNARSLLATSIGIADTEVRVRAGTGSKFPTITAGQWFPITLEDAIGGVEIMRCTARNGDVLTVQRGAEGTIARPFAVNDAVELRLTAASIQELCSDAATNFSRIYRTPLEGVDPKTGVANGYYFNVRGETDATYVDEYQNVNGTPVATGKSYPNRTIIDQIAASITALALVPGSLLDAVAEWSDLIEINGSDGNPHPVANLQAQALANRIQYLSSIKANSTDVNTALEGVNTAIGTKFPTAGGTITGSVTVQGDVTATGNVTAYSDRRLKDNINIIQNALLKVQNLNGVTFTRNDLEDTDKRYMGLIAQDVQIAAPEAVIVRDDENQTLAVDYMGLVGLLVESIKELELRVKKLEG